MYEKPPDMPLPAIILPDINTILCWEILILLLFASGMILVWKTAKKRIEHQVSQRIRQQIAHDFHDELGGKLSIISMYAELTSQQLDRDPEIAKAYLGKISVHASRLYETVKDMLWALNPDLDNSHDLLLRLKDFGEELFADSTIQFSAKSSGGLQGLKLSLDQKRHLLLLFKEGMHNVLKHSGAKLVLLEAAIIGSEFVFSLSDDGRGFDPQAISAGEGLKSMKNRAAKLGGAIRMESNKPGSRIEVRIALPAGGQLG
ncbi:MAG: hypothetical protein HUU01_11420 [Saprospiraceae bacterium]|nr:hypothetical protein [Saprospiraceae bacterium]